MQYKETQRIHESKKKEKEFERLKLKLGQVNLIFHEAGRPLLVLYVHTAVSTEPTSPFYRCACHVDVVALVTVDPH